MKDRQDVVVEFGQLVNMTPKELKGWLMSDDSRSAGWAGEKDDGESVGHESGRKIVAILESNPGKDPDKYTEEEVAHMRKVVSYCKRHLAQEERSNNDKPVEEVEKTKSFASLKNWGHDCIKARQEKGSRGSSTKENKKNDSKTGEKREVDAVDDDDDNEEKDGDNKKTGKAGGNKKAQAKNQNQTKKRKTDDKEKEVVNLEEDDEEEEQDGDDDADKGGEGGKRGKGGASAGPKKGDTVSWNWAGGQPKGEVKEVNPDETTIKTKRGNEVSRKGKPEDPAVVLETGKSDAIKLSHELNEQ